MRSDMSKVIVERPRFGRGYKFPRGTERHRTPIDADDDTGMPNFEGIKKPWSASGNLKCLNENLQPLKRFLNSRVGQLWNDIYSEIRANLRVDSAVQLHVIQHLEDFVALHVRMIDGEPHKIYGRGWEPVDARWWRDQFFVHPETGILMHSPKRKRQKYQYRSPYQPRNCPYERVTIGRMSRAFKIDGYWYELTLMPITEQHATQDGRVDVQDILLPETSRLVEFWDFYGGPYYAVKKRQMNSRAIRQLISDILVIPANQKDPSFTNSQRFERFRKLFRRWTNATKSKKWKAKQSPPYPNRQRGPAQTRSGAGSNPAGGTSTLT